MFLQIARLKENFWVFDPSHFKRSFILFTFGFHSQLWTCKYFKIFYCSFLKKNSLWYLLSFCFFSLDGIFLTKYVKSKLLISKINIRLINNNIYLTNWYHDKIKWYFTWIFKLEKYGFFEYSIWINNFG